jgi:hypothetical protein
MPSQMRTLSSNTLVPHAVLIIMNTESYLYGDRISIQRNLKEPSAGLSQYSTTQIV